MKKFFNLYNAAKMQVVDALKEYVKSRGGEVKCDESKTIVIYDNSEQDSKGNPMPLILRVKSFNIDNNDKLLVTLDDMGEEWIELLSGFSVDTIFDFADTIID